MADLPVPEESFPPEPAPVPEGTGQVQASPGEERRAASASRAGAADLEEGLSVPSTSVTPHNREAEEAVVGAVLINPEVYYDLAQFLQADDFYIHRHRFIWEAFTRLHEKRIPLDFLTVTEELQSAGQLAEIGGPAYLTALLNQVPTSLHAEAYGRMVEASAIRRRLLTSANQIASLAYDEHESVENVIEESEKSIFNVSERRLKKELLPISTVLSEYYDRIDELAKRSGEIFGVPTARSPCSLMIFLATPNLVSCSRWLGMPPCCIKSTLPFSRSKCPMSRWF